MRTLAASGALVFLAVLAITAGHGCGGDDGGGACTSSADCEDPAAPACDTSGLCVECAASTDCTAPEAPICANSTCVACSDADQGACAERDPEAPICAVGGRCVQCVAPTDCGGDTPICGPGGACVGCTSNFECPSVVCDVETGACIDESSVLYVGAAGGSAPANTETCGTKAEQCASIAYAIEQRLPDDPARNWLAVSGNQGSGTGGGDRIAVLKGTTVNIVGTGTPTITGGTGGTVVLVETGSTLYMRDFAIQGSDSGIQCAANGVATSVRLRGIEITSGVRGIESTECDVSATQVAIDDSGTGVQAQGGSLELRRSKITGNASGAMVAENASIDIENCFINDNGSDIALLAAVTLAGSTTGSFAFNTVLDNQRGTTGGDAAGVDCGQTEVVQASSNIVWGNDKDGVTGDEQVPATSMCQWTYSDIQQDVDGTGNINVEPVFSGAVLSYSLEADENPMLEGAADPAATLDIDLDGNARPLGSGRDIGAYEIPE